MKRVLLVVVLLAIVIAALGSHGNKTPTATRASTGQTRSATQSAKPPSQHRATARISYTPCDQNITVGPHTTCAFADNVFRAFASQAETGSEEGTVRATSAATGKEYEVRCSTTNGTTLCAGGTDARIRFPLWAAKVYNGGQPAKQPAPSQIPEHESESGPAEPSEPERSGESGSECTNGTYENSSGNTVCKPEESSTQPAGATARCEDGTYSFSEHRSGTCSHHGGVAAWLNE